MSAIAALETRGLCKAFGALQVARSIDFRLDAGARHALIGPNGAGKTTFVNLITGVLRPSAGEVLLMGKAVTRLSQAARVRLGIARTFQINQLFRDLTVIENVLLAVAERIGASLSPWRPAGSRRDVLDEAAARLAPLGLLPVAAQTVRQLPYGQQRLVELAIALALRPKVLLLDEPAAGVPSGESHLILDALAALDPEMAVLIIEHDMDVVFRFARRVTVLASGAVLAEGTPAEIAENPEVRATYLGEAGLAGRGRHRG
jgi:ABC-type branched-subunit amino acid transport system ATPase component